MKYAIICKVDMTFLSSINDLVTSLNKSMKLFGFDEKIGLESECSVFEVTSDRELTNEEQGLLISEAQKVLNDSEILRKFKITELRELE